VRHGKGRDLKRVVLQYNSRVHLNEVNRYLRFPPSQDNTVYQIVYPLKRPTAAINLDVVDCLPTGKSGDQPAQTQNVIKMTVGKENPVQPLKAQPALQDLPLCPFATIDQKAIVFVQDYLG
jgi:hypothetical protein